MNVWGKHIQQERRFYRITQKQLADYAGISERHLRDLENCVIAEPEMDERYEIEQALQELIEGAPPVTPSAAGCRIWGRTLRRKRRAYGVTQQWFALQLGVTVKYLRGLESGEIAVSYDRQDEIMDAIERFNPEIEPLSIIIDYVRIRFATMDVRYIIEDVLRLKMKYLAQEDHGFYHYTGMYYIGDVCIMTSSDEELGVLLELKGKGCRQFECYLKAQSRDWLDFFRRCMDEDCVFKRLDLAVNDKAGLLHIPTLAEKCDRGEMLSVFRHTYEMGCTHFDTAEGYGEGANEELVGEALAPIRHKVTIATKLHLFNSENLEQQIESRLDASLKRLRTDYVDLYYQHRNEAGVPPEEVARIMGKLIQKGKIRGWGQSMTTAEEIRRASAVTPLSAVQSEYSMMERMFEKDVIPTCGELGIGFVAFSPMASGFLSGKYQKTEA